MIERDFWFDRIAQVENPTVVDVGANVGDYIPPNATVHAFEPNPRVFNTLKEKASDHVHIYPYAISSGVGKGILSVPIDAWRNGIATLGTPREERQELDWMQVEVDTVRLDDFDFGKVHFLKIDTEGNEYNVLMGAEHTIRNNEPEILIEYANANTQQFGYDYRIIIDLLKDWGYNEFRHIGREDVWARINRELNEPQLRYLIVGTGGCGSRSTAIGLQNAGLVATHERIFNFSGAYPNMDWWRHVEAEVSWLAVHHLNRFVKEYPDVMIVHLVRHPFRVTESIYDAGMIYSDNQGGYVLYTHNSLQTLHDYDSPWDKTAHYVVEWNKRCEPHADLLHRIEEGVPALMEKLGVPFNPEIDEWHHASNKKHPKLERGMIADELYDELEAMVERYGY